MDSSQNPPTSTAIGVTRSRTLPSRKKGSGDDTLDSSARRDRALEKRVLKKLRRVSGGGSS